ncbi:MAG: hypothetical protein K6F61_04075 [Clostridiales bacterium]|nr:hypothetical protein [Clostridiales bacterium]
MKAREFLLSVQKAERELLLISDRRRHYEDIIMAIGNQMRPYTGKPSGVSQKTETAAIGLVYLADKLQKQEEEYTALIKRAEELIGKLKQDKFREVLTRRYLNNESWKTIRDKMDYKDEKSVFRCHGYALKELQKFM